MGVLRSKLGWTLVVVYVGVFITVYAHVQEHRGTFLYDIGLDLLVLPYILVVGHLLLQQPLFAVHAHEPWGSYRQSSSAAGSSCSQGQHWNARHADSVAARPTRIRRHPLPKPDELWPHHQAHGLAGWIQGTRSEEAV